MKKPILLLCAAFVCALPAAYAEVYDMPVIEGEPYITWGEPETDNEERAFTVEEAVEYALEHSHDLEVKNLQIEAAQISLSQARAGKRELDKMPAMQITGLDGSVTSIGAGDVTNLSPYISTGYYTDAAEYNLKYAKKAYTQAKYELRAQVEKSFYNILSLDEKIANAQASLQSAKTRSAQAQERLALGMISRLDARSFELAVSKAQITLDALERGRPTALMAFKNTIGYPVNAPVTLTGTFERKAMDATPLDMATALSRTNINYTRLEDGYGLAKKKNDIDKRYYAPAQFEYRSAEAEFKQTEAQYLKNKDAIQIGVVNAYNTMVGNYDTLEYMDEMLAYTEWQAEVQKLRYEQGTITAQDYIETLQSVDELKNNIKDAEIQAYSSVIDYRATYTYDYIETE